MIRMIQSVSASHAKAYYSDALLKSDYYLNDQELSGEFQGRLAARLNIEGRATKEQFFALCENRHPLSGAPLTPRTRDNRTTGYDINFHCPKSVSVVHVLSKDDHIIEAFRQSVSETMTDIEADSKARIRKGGKYADRNTGELLWVDFTHQTARPVKDFEPDPHLHAHCYVFNATWDKTEGRVKAGKFKDIKRDMPYYEAIFHKRLSDKLIGLGYNIRRTAKSFEIDGVPEKMIDLFSKRTNEIGQIAKEKGITDAKSLDALGALTRSKKQKGFTMAELKSEWRQQINALDDIGNSETGKNAIRFGQQKERRDLSADKCLDYALSHSFERASVMPTRRLLETAFRHSLGASSVTVEHIAQRLKNNAEVIQITDRGQALSTTKDVLKEEQRMVTLAKLGQGKLQPLYDYEPVLDLNGQQAAAVKHILTTPDRVSIVRGAAGTGKTTLMREAVEKIEAKGKTVTVVAPTSSASRGVLRDEGFTNAETVASFLNNRQLQDSVKDQVLWVDEAGLLGTKDMSDLLEIATKQNARLILGGDTKQHASVVRGDALRILNTVGDIKSAEISKIYRQKNYAYRTAIEDLSKGEVLEGFKKLDAIGSIKVIDRMKPNEVLVDDYIKTIKKGKTGLVISPTNKQGDEVTDEIRIRMRKEKMLGKKELVAKKFENLNYTKAQKGDWRNFRPDQVIQFNQNAPGIPRGSSWTVKTVSEKEILMTDNDQTIPVPKDKADAYDLFEKKEIGLSKGDKIKVTRNSFDEDKRRMNNGQMLEVVSVKKSGQIKLKNTISKQTYVIDKDFGHINHAHCITSYAAQGKTVDEVFIAQPAATFPATDAKQFYVSVSRGREQARIYTDDKNELMEHAAQMGERKSAMELVGTTKRHLNYIHQVERDKYQPKEKQPKQEKELPKPTFTRDKGKDYEPGF